MTSNYVDILVVTDARLVGGGNKSLAQEILAHSAAGYTTGLLSLSGPARAVSSRSADRGWIGDRTGALDVWGRTAIQAPG